MKRLASITFLEMASLIDSAVAFTRWTYGSNWSTARSMHRYSSDLISFYDDMASMPTRKAELKFEIAFGFGSSFSFLGFNASIMPDQKIPLVISHVEKAFVSDKPLFDTLSLIMAHLPDPVICSATTGVEGAWQEFPNVELALNQFDESSSLDFLMEKISQVYLEGAPHPIVLEFMFSSNAWVAFSISKMQPSGMYFFNPIVLKLLIKRIFLLEASK
jgi:hypothetical protein